MTESTGAVYFVGSEAEVAHHAAPLAMHVDVRVVSPDDATRLAAPGDVVVFYNEYFGRFREACIELVANDIPTLYAIDGILEWRNSWDFPDGAGSCLQTMRPVLSHKAACIGRSQARALESWGNLGKCEVVGVPRFDSLLKRKPRTRPSGAPFRLLVMTAKTPGFTLEQWDRTKNSLLDLRAHFDDLAASGCGQVIEPVWRLAAGLAEAIGVENSLTETTGAELAGLLAEVDAVITTPSTSMLESMLHGLPTALLDYHNCPQYVPAAWTISAKDHVPATVAELVRSSPAKMIYQDAALHDALECHTPATPRMLELVEAMSRLGRESRERGTRLHFPRRMIEDELEGHHLPEERFDLRVLFPDHPVFSERDLAALQAEVCYLRSELKERRRESAREACETSENLFARLRRALSRR